MSILRRVLLSLALIACALVTAGALMLSAYPQLEPRDLLAPFRGVDGLLTVKGLVTRPCMTRADCERHPHHPCSGDWWCLDRACQWRCRPERACGRHGSCFRDELCEREGCSGQGRCVRRPDRCAEGAEPVCGCDGRSYVDDCHRRLAGASLHYAGRCVPGCVPAGRRVAWGPDEPTPRCCPGAEAVRPRVPSKRGEGCALEDCLRCLVCVLCGDGVCGPGEDMCVCGEDCR
jgi:hypothetical protein